MSSYPQRDRAVLRRLPLLLIAGITLHTWWAVGLALAGVFGGTAVVLYVVMKTVLAGGDDEPDVY